MKFFGDIHDTYNKYMLNRAYTFNQFIDIYNSFSIQEKDMMNFIISKQDFLDINKNKLDVENIQDFWNEMNSNTINSTKLNIVNVYDYNLERTNWDNIPCDIIDKGWRQKGDSNLIHKINRPNSLKLRVNVVDENEVNDIWEKVYPVLKEHEDQIVYKMPEDMEEFKRQNLTESQKGKFLTIYTTSNEQGLELAKKIDNALNGFDFKSYSAGTDISVGNSGIVSATIDRDEFGEYISDLRGDREKHFKKNFDYFKENGLVYGLSEKQNIEKASSLGIIIPKSLNTQFIDLAMSNRKDILKDLILSNDNIDVVGAIKELKESYPKQAEEVANLSFSLFAAKNDVIKMQEIASVQNIDPNYSNGIFIRNAAANGQYEAVNYLINLGADKNLALLNSAKYDRTQIITKLITENRDLNIPMVVSNLKNVAPNKVDSFINSSFSALAAVNDVSEMEALRLSGRLNINHSNNLPIRNAAANGNYEAVNYLIEHGASKEMALHNSLKYKQTELSENLIRENPDIDTEHLKKVFTLDNKNELVDELNNVQKSMTKNYSMDF